MFYCIAQLAESQILIDTAVIMQARNLSFIGGNLDIDRLWSGRIAVTSFSSSFQAPDDEGVKSVKGQAK